MNLKIIFEDNHIIVVLKPRGVLSQAGDIAQPDMVNILKEYIKDKYNKPGNVYLGLVHRLDINVAGLMVFAKTSKAAKRLSEQIRNHDFTKKYLAIVKGSLNNDNGLLEDYIVKDEVKRQARLGDITNGKLAKLEYETLDKAMIFDEKYSLIKINLITGRFHQIRFQLSNAEHPILGDSKYGGFKPNREFFLGLYAYQIEFEHPTKKEQMIFNLKPEHKFFIQFAKLNDISWR
ncbi:MAG: RluA family pseudouridine synthase [Tenericutes bacterium]|nr:RluA family pseudouridine synthase [Mycoplasmatota bacterium]